MADTRFDPPAPWPDDGKCRNCRAPLPEPPGPKIVIGGEVERLTDDQLDAVLQEGLGYGDDSRRLRRRLRERLGGRVL